MTQEHGDAVFARSSKNHFITPSTTVAGRSFISGEYSALTTIDAEAWKT
jgi:hypothetical protein